MNIKKLGLSAIAGFVVMLGLGGLAHMYLLKDWFMAHLGAAGNLSRPEPKGLYIMAGTGVLACIMAYIYPKGVEGNNKIMEGLKFGAIMGVLFIVPFSLILYGVTTVFSGQAILMNTGLHIVIQGLGGLTIAYVYGDNPKA